MDYIPLFFFAVLDYTPPVIYVFDIELAAPDLDCFLDRNLKVLILLARVVNLLCAKCPGNQAAMSGYSLIAMYSVPEPENLD